MQGVSRPLIPAYYRDQRTASQAGSSKESHAPQAEHDTNPLPPPLPQPVWRGYCPQGASQPGQESSKKKHVPAAMLATMLAMLCPRAPAGLENRRAAVLRRPWPDMASACLRMKFWSGGSSTAAALCSKGDRTRSVAQPSWRQTGPVQGGGRSQVGGPTISKHCECWVPVLEPSLAAQEPALTPTLHKTEEHPKSCKAHAPRHVTPASLVHAVLHTTTPLGTISFLATV